MHDKIYFTFRRSEDGLHVPEYKVLKDINVDRQRKVRVLDTGKGKLLHDSNPGISDLLLVPEGVEGFEDFQGLSVSVPQRKYSVAFSFGGGDLDSLFVKDDLTFNFSDGFLQSYNHGALWREHIRSVDEGTDKIRESDLFIVYSKNLLDILEGLHTKGYYHKVF